MNELFEGFPSVDTCRTLFKRIETLSRGRGEVGVALMIRLEGVSNWARNHLHLSSDANDINVMVTRNINGATGSATTTRLDDDGLKEATQSAEVALTENDEDPDYVVDTPVNEPILAPVLWSQSTYMTEADIRSELARSVIKQIGQQGLISAGYIKIGAEVHVTMNSSGLFRYYPKTDVQCSVIVRNGTGSGSGWAGGHHYDLAKVDISNISSIAVDKCLRSKDPVAVEPGRYTVIMEPQATADLFTPILEKTENWAPGMENEAFIRPLVEIGIGPFYKRNGYSRITDQVVDKRLTLSADPMDPDAGFVPFDRYRGEPYKPVKWIEHGILKELSYPRSYALRSMGTSISLKNSLSYRLGTDGPTMSISDMILSTERGILVTRFGTIQIINLDSLLCTGYTRDGLWLIEHGKITKPVKNLRFTESPLFALNNLEACGEAKRTFSPPFARMAPAVKVRDFSFTSVAEAV